jgi:hypothetical protein
MDHTSSHLLSIPAPQNSETSSSPNVSCPLLDLLTHYIIVINSERAAMLSPDFKGKMIRTNKQLLAEITKTFIPRAKERPKRHERPNSHENTTKHELEQHSNGTTVSSVNETSVAMDTPSVESTIVTEDTTAQ